MANSKKSDGKAAQNKDKKSDDPCWNGYEQVGMKEKDGKKVPNCVPEEKKKG